MSTIETFGLGYLCCVIKKDRLRLGLSPIEQSGEDLTKEKSKAILVFQRSPTEESTMPEGNEYQISKVLETQDDGVVPRNVIEDSSSDYGTRRT